MSISAQLEAPAIPGLLIRLTPEDHEELRQNWTRVRRPSRYVIATISRHGALHDSRTTRDRTGEVKHVYSNPAFAGRPYLIDGIEKFQVSADPIWPPLEKWVANQERHNTDPNFSSAYRMAEDMQGAKSMPRSTWRNIALGLYHDRLMREILSWYDAQAPASLIERARDNSFAEHERNEGEDYEPAEERDMGEVFTGDSEDPKYNAGFRVFGRRPQKTKTVDIRGLKYALVYNPMGLPRTGELEEKIRESITFRGDARDFERDLRNEKSQSAANDVRRSRRKMAMEKEILKYEKRGRTAHLPLTDYINSLQEPEATAIFRRGGFYAFIKQDRRSPQLIPLQAETGEQAAEAYSDLFYAMLDAAKSKAAKAGHAELEARLDRAFEAGEICLLDPEPDYQPVVSAVVNP